MAVQPGLYLTCLENPKDRFPQDMALIYSTKKKNFFHAPVSFDPVKMLTQKCFPNARRTNIGNGLVLSSFPEELFNLI